MYPHSRRLFGLLAIFGVLLAATAGTGCGRSIEGPEPAATGADPQVVCGEQLETMITIRGEGFSPAPVDGLTDEPLLAIPRVTLLRVGDIDGSELPDGGVWVLNEDATDPEGDRVLWSSQEELTLRIDEALALERGIYDVHVENATGGEASLSQAFAAVPPPVLDSIEPLPVCTAQHTNTLVLSGSWFLTIGEGLPTVSIGGRDYVPAATECEVLRTPREDEVQRCSTLTIEMGVDDLDPGAHDVVVTNPEPAHCQTTEPVELHVVPPPSVSSVTEQPICLVEDARSLVVAGSGFLEIRGDEPEVRIGSVIATLESMEGCEPIEGLEEVRTCATLNVTVEQDALEEGRYDVLVTNPEPAHCHSEENATLTVVPPPSLAEVAPQPICNAQGETILSVTGTGFLELRGSMPEVFVNEVAATSVTVVQESCVQLDDASLETWSCTELAATFEQATLESGLHSVRVENPLPAGCSSTEEVDLSVAPPPSLNSIEPNPVCVAQTDMAITLIGEGFLEIDGEVGTLTLESTLDGSVVTPIDLAADHGYCSALPGVEGAYTCSRLTALIEADSLVDGVDYLATVTNPPPADCFSTETVELGVIPPPELDAASISPDAVCMGGAVFTVEGTNLTGIDAYLQSDTHTEWAANVTVNEDGTQATLFFTALQPGSYRLFVTGPGGCGDATEGMAITVETGPTIFFVDPPVVFNAVPMRVSIYITRLSEAPTEVAILPSDRTDQTGEILLESISWDPDRPNLVQATIPLPDSGPIEPGKYDLVVRGLEGCDAFLEEGIEVVGETTIALADPPIVPPYGESETRVAVSIHALDENERPAGEVGFEATPRAYLSSGLFDTAEPLRAVSFESDTTLTAVVPALAEGFYDLIVVNPDGSVGFAADAYRATDIAPPIIDDVYPTQLDWGDEDLTIFGENFFFDEEADDLGLTATAICRNDQGAILDYEISIDTEFSSSSLLVATLDASAIDHGTVCVVRVDNTEDDTFDEWSAITVTNPAGRLPAFLPGSSMVEARRAPAMAVARATREARFVYAIGGDGGTIDLAKGTVETSSLGRFGGLGAWRVLQTSLIDESREPTTRTLATGHRDDRFIYLIGGMTESGEVVSDVLRALVLDPMPPAVPEIVDVDIDFAGDIDDYDDPYETPPETDGLGRGAWTYMVSAIMADTDPENPGGETLPSEATTLYLPDVPGGMTVELTWSSVFDSDGEPAQAYFVYRTPEADSPLSEMHLLAIVSGSPDATHSYLDENADPLAQDEADPDKRAMRLGALGTWHLVGNLGTPRAAFGFATAPDPDGTALYWYAIGGIVGGEEPANESSSYEWASFDHDAMAPGIFTQAEAMNLAARREHGSWVANASTVSYIDEGSWEAYLYAGYGSSGALDNASHVTNNRVAVVLPGGSLGAPSDGEEHAFEEAMSAAAAVNLHGFASFMAADRAYRLGGASGNTPSSAANQAPACQGTGTPGPGGACEPPLLREWSDAANSLLHARYLPGFARSGAFFYLAGGANAAGDPIDSTESNVR